MPQTEKKSFLLPLNLQLFAAGDPQDPPADPPGNPQDPPADPPKTFTQEELDRIVKERLAREKKKAEDEAERKRLEDQKKFEDLYAKEKAAREALEQQVKAKEVDDLKTKTILGAGYTVEQLDFVKGIVKGETEEELKASIAEVQKFVPVTKPTGGDPSPGNGRRQDPDPKSDEELGRDLFRRLRGKK